MKKILLSVLAVAVTLVACNRYDDDFDALNQKLQDLEQKINTLEELRSQVTNLQLNVGALAQGLQGVGAQVAGLSEFSAAVTAILGDISDLQAALDASSSDSEVAALQASLNSTLAELEALVVSNGDMLAAVLSSVADNKEVLDSLVEALADIQVDLTSVLAALGTSEDFESVMDAFTQVLSAITASTATNTANLNSALAAILADNAENTEAIVAAILSSLEDLTGEIAAAQAALEADSAENLATVIAAIATLSELNETNQAAVIAAMASMEGDILLSITNNVASIIEGQGTLSDELAAALSDTIESIGVLSTLNASNQTALLAALSSIASQNSAIQEAVNAVLALQVTYAGDLYITNAAELEFALALGSKVEFLNGDLYVETTTASGITAAQVNPVINRIKAVVSSYADPASNNPQGDVARVSIVADGSNALDFSVLSNISGDLTIRTSGTATVDLGSLNKVTGQVSIGTTAAHDLSALRSVTGDYYVSGFDIDDSALESVGGNANFNHLGAYIQPALKTVGGLYIVDYAGTTGTTSVDFSGLTSVTNFATITSEDAAAHHSGGGSSAGTSASTIDAPVGGTPYTLVLRAATSIKIGQAAVVSITAPLATDIDHNFTGILPSLNVVAVSALTIDVQASSVSAATSITSGDDTVVTLNSNLNGLTIVDGETIVITNTTSAGSLVFAPVVTGSVSLTTSTAGSIVANAGASYTVSATTIGSLDFNAGSSIDISGNVSGVATFDAAAGANILLAGNYGSTLNVNGSNAASVNMTGASVSGQAAITVAPTGSIASSHSFITGISTVGGTSVSLTGSSATDVNISSVSATGDVVVNNNIGAGGISITGSDQVTFGMTSITGVVDVNMTDSGSLSAPNLTTLGNTVTIDALSISVPSLKTIAGAAVFANETGLDFPELLSANTITAVKAKDITAPKFSVTTTLTLKNRVNLAVAAAAEVSAILKTTSSANNLANKDNWISISLLELASDFDSNDFVGLSSFSANSKDATVDISINGDNEDLSSLSVSGNTGILSVGSINLDGLDKLVSFSTTGTLKKLEVFNAKSLTGMNLSHTENTVDGIQYEIRNNDKLDTFVTSSDKVTSFIVTGNEALRSFNADSFVTLPLDVDNAVNGNNIAFRFEVNDNFTNTTGMVGTHQANDASNEEAFYQGSLESLKSYILLVRDALKLDDGSTMTISMNYRLDGTTTTVVGDTDANVTSTAYVENRLGGNAVLKTGVGSGINTMDEVEAIFE